MFEPLRDILLLSLAVIGGCLLLAAAVYAIAG